MVRLRFYALLAFVLASSAVATAQERGTEAEQLACTPDVLRLCSSFIPSEEDIIACLQSKRTQLSPGCAKAFYPALIRRNRQR